MYIVGLGKYTGEDIKLLCTNKKVAQIVLGDILCDRRMFKNVKYDLVDFAKYIQQSGKKTVLQTNVYVTDRNFQQTLELVQYLYSSGLVSDVLVQDVGLATRIASELGNVNIIWSRMGRVRNSIANSLLAAYLKSIGVSTVETDREGRIALYKKNGLDVHTVFGNVYYNTINRECYSKYESGNFGDVCHRECLTRVQEMVSADTSLNMIVDGHILGSRLQYNAAPEFKKHSREYNCCVTIYAKDVNGFQVAVRQWEE